MEGLLTRDRDSALDNAKGVGMLLIVLGHSPSVDMWLQTFLYSFHVPLFFFISGVLVSEKRLEMKFPEFARYYGVRLIWPYLFFFLISYLYWILSKDIGSKSALYAGLDFFDPIYGFFYASGDYLYVNVALWFFPCLYVSLLALYLGNKVFRQWLLLATLLISLFFVFQYDSTTSVPFCLDNAMVALFFIALGFRLKNVVSWFTHNFKQSHSIVLLIITLSALLLVCGANGRVDLNGMSFGEFGGLYYVSSITGIILVLSIGRMVGENRILRWISENSIFIFPLHSIFFGVITGFCVIFLGFDIEFKSESVYYSYLYSILSVVMTYFFVKVLKLVNLHGVIR